MPTSRPCAAFEPISPDFDVKKLVESTPTFDYVPRIHVDMVNFKGPSEFERLVRKHVILGGKPLIVEGYESKLDRWTFALQWLRDNCSAKVENARDLTKKVNVPLSIGHYLNHMAMLTNQWNDKNYKETARQRIYLKDIDCPPLWQEKLQDIILPNVFYLNESVGDYGGFGSVDEADPSGSGTRKGRGVAKAGDLMSSLPKEMRAENLMCYIGHEGTYTPAHKEMCASLGQNIMVETSTGVFEDGKPTKPGSSIWFMTESKEREVVSEYWLSKLGHDIEVENHFAQVNAWRAAPFKTWVVEQRVGDLILIPPLAPHQVWNRGTRTMKVAWNRTTVETLEMALHDALPAARMVCRDEQYKNKAIIYYTLQKYSKLIKLADKQSQKQNRRNPTSEAYVVNLKNDFRRLEALFTEVLVSESFYPANFMNVPKPEMVPYDSNITCSYCRCNIFNRFLTCPSCVSTLPDGEEDTYDICMDCYAMGRSCACISKLKWVEQWSWGELTQNHEKWRHQILQTEGQVSEKSPKSLRTELEMLGKHRTLAQVCQSELAHRPFNDIEKEKVHVNLRKGELDEPEVDANGNVKKSKKPRKSEKFIREHARCHVDCHWEPKWKQADCSNCDKKYCFGLLFRAYDMMPQDILADPEWICPSCRNICSCRNCRDRRGFKPYTPSGTMLGHNTKAIADPRSVESLVDFGYSNISWIQKAGDDNEDDTRRMKKRQEAAQIAKDKDAEADDAYDQTQNEIDSSILMLAQQEGIPIDPALAAMTSGAPNNSYDQPTLPDGSQDDEDEYDENPEQARVRDEGPGGPPAPQYVIPAGGVVRDAEHAYDNTEAITYDYPDPETGMHAPAPVEAAADDSGAAPGYELVVQGNDVDISMIERKRKRAKVDEGDLTFGYRPTPQKKKKQEKRKSLIVKLNVDKTKLAEVQSIQDIAQQALNGVAAAEAPVLSSDLQALNAYGSAADGQPQRKKVRLEEPESEEDEFTPGRYRDRRKTIPEGAPRPDPDAEITRRQTRMQVTNYEEPSDEDIFGDVVEVAAKETSKSKLATMEQAGQEVHLVSDDDESASHNSPPAEPTVVSINAASDPMELDIVEAEKPEVAPEIAPQVATQNSAPKRPPTGSLLSTVTPSSIAKVPQNGVHISGTSHNKPKASTTAAMLMPKGGPSKAEIQAKANQKAKMAAMEWAENDSSDRDEDSEVETLPSKVYTRVPMRRPESSEANTTESEEQPQEKSVSLKEKSLPTSSTSNSDSGRKSRPLPIASTKQKQGENGNIDTDDSEQENLARKGTKQALATHAKPNSRRETLPAGNGTPLVTQQQRQPTPKSAPAPQAKPRTSILASKVTVTAAASSKKVALPKVSAEGWSDSDSDTDSRPQATKASWTTVNKKTSNSITSSKPAVGVAPVAGPRKRGRPPKSSLYAGKR
jgi:hypothetical protein